MSIMEQYGIILYGIKLFIATGFYLHSLKKREGFLLRFAVGFVLYGVVLVALPKTLPYPASIFMLFTVMVSLALLLYETFRIDAGTLFFVMLAGVATEHAANLLNNVLCMAVGILPVGWKSLGMMVVSLGITFGICYRPFIQVMSYISSASISKKGMIVIAAVITLVSLVSHSMIDRQIVNYGGSRMLLTFYNLNALLTVYLSLTVLFSTNQKDALLTEKAIIESLLVEQKERYKFSAETIRTINLKCHDMKHQINRLRKEYSGVKQDASLKELEDAILIYDQTAPTYNVALDSIVSEKGLYCNEHQISFTYMADGSLLQFMDAADIYTLLGNGIDNAIEAVENLEKEKRFIFLRIQQMRGLVQIHIENYCDRKIEVRDGFPVTHKKDKQNHGFGVRSMQYILEKYDGQISFHQENSLFCLDMIVPIKNT